MEIAIAGGIFMLIVIGIPACVLKYKVDHDTTK
jgi:hypothetical protein